MLFGLDADRRKSAAAAAAEQGGPFDLPYRMVFAVASVETVIVYDTSGGAPLAVLGGLHFEAAPITDIAWSCDGRYLAISSYDGELSYHRYENLQCLHQVICGCLQQMAHSPSMPCNSIWQ